MELGLTQCHGRESGGLMRETLLERWRKQAIACYILALLATVLMLAIPASAADLAILHNGFSIRHERREIVGSVTRLYLTSDGSGFVDIPTGEIERFEKDLSPPPSAYAARSRERFRDIHRERPCPCSRGRL